MHRILFFLFLTAVGIGCKKNVNFPPDIRPNEFWARYSITNDTGIVHSYLYQGEDTTASPILPGYTEVLSYFTTSAIQDSIKRIDAGLSSVLAGAPITVRLYHPDQVTDPFTATEWTEAELETILYPGKSFVFGSSPGEARLTFNDYPDKTWSCTTTALSNQGGYLRVESVEEYGSPEIGVPYFGKKVKLSFAGTLYHASGKVWEVHDGEAVLLFRYFKF